MTQTQFNKKFTKEAFVRFLKSLKTCAGIDVGSEDSCLFGRFSKRLFATRSVKVYWQNVIIKGKSFTYPPWAKCYLTYLNSAMDVNSTAYATMVKDASIAWLAD